eukprot:9046617-Pyramimonas_sp.AAC.1
MQPVAQQGPRLSLTTAGRDSTMLDDETHDDDLLPLIAPEDMAVETMPLPRQATRSPPHEREALLCQAEGPDVAALTTAAIEHIARVEATNTTGWRQPLEQSRDAVGRNSVSWAPPAS